jgi:plasmid maintenance system antidote protein VapI
MGHLAKRTSTIFLRKLKPLSPAVAVYLVKSFGDGAGVWVRMQAAYNTWNAEHEPSAPKRRRSRTIQLSTAPQKRRSDQARS